MTTYLPIGAALDGTLPPPVESRIQGKIDTASTGDRARGNHTGAQPSTTISDFTEAVQDILGAALIGSGVTVTYDDTAGTVVITGSGSTDLEAVRDAIGVALIGVGNISVTVDDPGNTITIATSATVNSTDAALRDRSTHTGTQAASTVTGLAAVATSGLKADVGLGNVDNTSDASKIARYRGKWATSTAYIQGDRVLKNGRIWEARSTFTSGTVFQVANWLPLATVQRQSHVVCTSRNAPTGGPSTGLSDGTNTSQNTRIAQTFRTAVGRAVVRFGNWVSTASYDVGPGNDITVSASIELSTGRIIPITFNGGSLSVTIPTLGTVSSDPISIGVPAGTTGWFRTYVRVASAGQKWPVYGLNSTGDTFTLSTSGTDSTQTTGVLATTSATGIYQPLDCVAIDSIADTPSVVIVGDSIGATPERASFCEIPLTTAGIPYVNLARLGDSATNWRLAALTSLSASEKSAQRRKLLDDGTHVICEMGRNDVSGGFTLGQMQSLIQDIWTMLRNHGAMWIAQTTITPKTTSTDSWATVGNQTTDATDTVRQSFNAWLLSSGVATGLVDQIFDTAAVAQASSDASKWTAGWCSDGLHPNSTGAAAIAAAIDATKITFV